MGALLDLDDVTQHNPHARAQLDYLRSENAEMARLLGMSAERELKLRDTLEELLLATEFYISGKSVRNLDEILLRAKRLT